MMNPGLDAAGVEKMKRVSCSVHDIYVQVQILDWNHNYLGDASNMLIDGQINFSSNSEITRTGNLSLWDPEYDLGLDSPNPSFGALYYFRQIKITYCIWEFGDIKSIDIPLFCGPITDLNRNGGQIDISVSGKEWIFGNFWKPMNFVKGANRRNIIAAILKQGGEARLSFESFSQKLGAKTSYAREAFIWPEAKKMASSLSAQLFYDGRGTARLRDRPDNPSFVFRDGNGGSLTTVPRFGFTDEERRNVVWLVGGKPKGSKRTTTYTSTLPTSSPLNHNILARLVDGKKVPTIYLEKLQESKVTRSSDAKKRADASLNSFKNIQMAISFDALVLAFMEEGDMTQLNMTGEYSLPLRMDDFSVPLIGPTSAYGSNKNLALARRK